jgi:hypothetical protein
MPRRVEPLCFIALSPQQCAAALGINVRHIYAAQKRRELVARMYGARRSPTRILVRDLIQWVETTWKEVEPVTKLEHEDFDTPSDSVDAMLRQDEHAQRRKDKKQARRDRIANAQNEEDLYGND